MFNAASSLSGTVSRIAAEAGQRPVLLAGPTASGKSALAMALAGQMDRPIVNADAIQVFADWRVLTARPSEADEAAHPHFLYGHVPGTTTYSAGHWLRDIAPLLQGAPIVVGGTGLNFAALTAGLADIPETPADIRDIAVAHLRSGELAKLVAELDAETRARIDTANPMRVQRAWEVLTATGRGLASWQDDTGPPLLPLKEALGVVLEADRNWLAHRIEARTDQMLTGGAVEEARANEPAWVDNQPSAKAIGARELIAHVRGTLSLAEVREALNFQTRQYAKRQRTWFRGRMAGWTQILCP